MPSTDNDRQKTPGVYVTELDAFPPSIVGVQTDVPAFIGYTEKADANGKSVSMQPVKITSLAEFETIFGKACAAQFDLVAVTDSTAIGEGEYCFKVSQNGTEKYYDLVQTVGSQFNLYNSMRLFYANGGDTCYVVSAGSYADQPGISQQKLAKGLEAIADQIGPTMLVLPDAVLLPTSDHDNQYQNTIRQMLEQCGKLQDRVAILDVPITQDVTGQNLGSIIAKFRTDVGSQQLNYGMSYFPYLDTTVTSINEIDYTNISPNSIDTLISILTSENNRLNPDANQHTVIQKDIDAISTTARSDQQAVQTLNQNLTAAIPLLKDIETMLLHDINQLPCSGAMAGIYTTVDNTKGVWNAPANISLTAVNNPSFKLDNEQQGDLNVPLDGKAVNAIREFPGRGSVVWGARTLDGNSNDWRYIHVRRTLIYIEQSIKTALDQFVFAPNDGKTWSTVTAMVSSFLQGVWSQGGLMGATASEAFTVECGIGSTMTKQDILEGYMIVQVTLQMIRPAEFIELTFKQEMQTGS